MARAEDGAMAAWRGLVLARVALVRELEGALEEAEGLSLWDLKALRALAASGDGCRRMTDLARAIGYTPSGITRLVERLERSGLVERRPCAEDGRGAVAALTPGGRARARRAGAAHRRHVRERLGARLDEAELAELGRLLERLLPEPAR